MSASLDQIEQEAYKHARQWPIWLVYRIRQYEHVVEAAQSLWPPHPPAEEDVEPAPAASAASAAHPWLAEPLGPNDHAQPGSAVAWLLAQTDTAHGERHAPDHPPTPHGFAPPTGAGEVTADQIIDDEVESLTPTERAHEWASESQDTTAETPAPDPAAWVESPEELLLRLDAALFTGDDQ